MSINLILILHRTPNLIQLEQSCHALVIQAQLRLHIYQLLLGFLLVSIDLQKAFAVVVVLAAKSLQLLSEHHKELVGVLYVNTQFSLEFGLAPCQILNVVRDPIQVSLNT